MPDNAIRDLDQLYRRLIKQVNSRINRTLLGNEAVRLIYNRVKSGYGVNRSGRDPDKTKRVRLEPLSSKYIDQRLREAKKLGKFGSPRRSNLTFTGQMLEALFSDASGNKIVVSIKNSARKDTNETNKDIAFYVDEDGRPFLALTRTEMRILTKKIESIIARAIKKIFI